MTEYTTRNKVNALVKKHLQEANTILDIGCGIRPQKLIQPVVHICADPHKEYLDYIITQIKPTSKSLIITLNLQWKDITSALAPQSVDSIFLLDVIEHLNKNEAKILLKKTLKIARKQVIVFTPYGFIEQNHEDDTDAWGLHGGKWQNHLSGWKPSDFGAGWKTIVVKKFHYTDNMGHKHKKPLGAMWAIYTNPEKFAHNPDIELNLQLYKASINAHIGKMTRLFIKH